MASEPQRLNALIAELDAQRALLGDAVVDSALAPLRAALAALDADPAAESTTAATTAAAVDAQTLKQVTILFLDVVGSTRLSQHLDPEDIHGVIDTLLARCTAIVQAHAGKVLQYAGDSVLAVFGADATREDDAERAIHAGLAILDEGAREADAVRERHGQAGFGVRVGVHTGAVLLGGGVDAAGSIRGMAVNIAARMEQSAPPGGLRISRDTYRHVRGVFDVQEQPPLAVKGLDAPVVTYLVRSARPRAFRDTRRGIEGVATALVGRDAELAALTRAFEGAVERGTPALVTLVADAGLGKSRLLAEFEHWLEQRAGRVELFRGRAHPQSIGQPYGVLRELLCRRFEIQDSDSLECAQAKLAHGLGPVFGARADEQTALLGQLIGLDYRASPHVAGIVGDARQLRARAFHAGVEYFRALCNAGRPLTLLLDDLHWADEGSLDFVAQLARAAVGAPLLVLCAARPPLYERRPGWGGALANPLRIDLSALGNASRRELATALLARVDDPPAMLQELIDAGADGNPFYMEELTLMLIDDGVIVTDAPRWRVVPDKLLALHVPTTLTGILQARIDALPAAERQALQQASVIGAVFWDEALAQLDPRAPRTLPALDRRHVVLGHAASAFEHTREFAFIHHLLHQVTYDGVLKRHKREQHRITALWLEQRCAERSGEYLGLLAEHFERAGLAGRALHYWTQAADHAARCCADDAALAHTERALALAAGADAADRFRLFNVREGVFARRAARAAQAEAIAELERLAQASGDNLQRLQAAQRRAWYLFATEGALQQAIDVAHAALAWAGAQPHGDTARVYNVLVGACARLGRFDEARAHGQAGLVVARAAGDRTVQAHLLNNLGNVEMESGDLGQATAMYEDAVAMFRALGNRWGTAGALGNLANLSSLLGQHKQARRRLDENLRLSAEVGNPGAQTNCLVSLSQVMLELGDASAARAAADSALLLARETGDRFHQAQALASLGEADAALGQWQSAREQHTRACEGFDPMGMVGPAAESRAALARIALATGDAGAALAAVQTVVERLGESPATFAGAFALRLTCWRALAACGDNRADAVLAHAQADLHAAAAKIQDPVLRASFLDNVAAHRELLAAGPTP